MAKYRIKVDALDPKEKVSEELLNGWECNGFFMGMMDDKEDDNTFNTTIAIHDTNTLDMAKAIYKSTELMEAALIAQGLEQARLLKKSRNEPKVQKAFSLADMLRKMAEDE